MKVSLDTFVDDIVTQSAVICTGQVHLALALDYRHDDTYIGSGCQILSCDKSCTNWPEDGAPLITIVWWLHRHEVLDVGIASYLAHAISHLAQRGR